MVHNNDNNNNNNNDSNKLSTSWKLTGCFCLWFPAVTSSNGFVVVSVLSFEWFLLLQETFCMVSVFRCFMVSVLPQHHLCLTDGNYMFTTKKIRITKTTKPKRTPGCVQNPPKRKK